MQLLFAFSYTEKPSENGWNVYKPLEEYSRMGVPNESWRVSRINENYQLADSYPSVVGGATKAINQSPHCSH